jgi:2'-5' RNA ligase
MAEPENPAAPSWRLFIALAVPETVKSAIARARDELRRALPERCARWTPREQFHLTLRFLGSVDSARAPELIEAARVTCGDFAALRLRAERIGCFPDLRRPRVVWAGVQNEAGCLARLQQAVERAAARFAESAAEGEFSGHITLARLKHLRRTEADALTEQVRRLSDGFFGEWVAAEVEILRSELSSTGARHTVLAAVPLVGAVGS